jgi:hypothetical protein
LIVLPLDIIICIISFISLAGSISELCEFQISNMLMTRALLTIVFDSVQCCVLNVHKVLAKYFEVC